MLGERRGPRIGEAQRMFLLQEGGGDDTQRKGGLRKSSLSEGRDPGELGRTGFPKGKVSHMRYL